METSLLLITFIAGLIAEAFKKTSLKITTKNTSHLIPIISLISGIIISITCFYTNMMNVGETLIEAIIVGAIGGAGMTGLHQLPTQMRKYYQNLSNNPNDVESMKNLIDLFKLIIDGVQVSINNETSSSNDNKVSIIDDNKSKESDDIPSTGVAMSLTFCNRRDDSGHYYYEEE